MPKLDKIFKFRESEENPEAVKPFLDHLEDLRWMLVKIAITLGIGMGVAFAFRSPLVAVVQHPLLSGGPARRRPPSGPQCHRSAHHHLRGFLLRRHRHHFSYPALLRRAIRVARPDPARAQDRPAGDRRSPLSFSSSGCCSATSACCRRRFISSSDSRSRWNGPPHGRCAITLPLSRRSRSPLGSHSSFRSWSCCSFTSGF